MWKNCKNNPPIKSGSYKVKGLKEKVAYYNTEIKAWIYEDGLWMSYRVFPTYWKDTNENIKTILIKIKTKLLIKDKSNDTARKIK